MYYTYYNVPIMLQINNRGRVHRKSSLPKDTNPFTAVRPRDSVEDHSKTGTHDPFRVNDIGKDNYRIVGTR